MDNNDEAAVSPNGEEEPDLEANLASIMGQVEPILDGLFKAAAENDDYWLKGKSVRIFSDWIVSVLNVSQVMEQQVQALSVTVQAQEKELEQTRTVKAKMWTPGV